MGGESLEGRVQRGHSEGLSQVLPSPVRIERTWLSLEICSFHKKDVDGISRGIHYWKIIGMEKNGGQGFRNLFPTKC